MTHVRRKIVHFNITESPTADWSAQQVVDAFPYDTAPTYLLRDRHSIYGTAFVRRVDGMGIKQKLIAPRSPGKVATSSDWSVRFGASAWIDSLCSMNGN
jgi:hypothetical protein